MTEPQIITTKSIQGNSNIGVPVYSKFAQMQNYNFIVLSPQKQQKVVPIDEVESLVNVENEKFRIEPIRALHRNEANGEN